MISSKFARTPKSQCSFKAASHNWAKLPSPDPHFAPHPTSPQSLPAQSNLPGSLARRFIDGPMKQVTQAFPLLTMCRTSACGDSCQKFHPPVDDDHIDNVVLDIWGGQWVSNSGARTDKARAVCWTALIRTPQLVLPNLLTLSGTNGLFIDPRDPTGRLPDENYGVVWLSGATWQTAHHKHRTTEGSLSIVRLNDRYGLRFHAARSRSRTSTSSFLCHMALSARASSSPLLHGNGEPNHCNRARATTMASDGKLAPKTLRQTASCREHMVTSWSLSYALCGLKRPTPHLLPLTAPSSTSTATKTSLLALPPTTPGSQDMTRGPHGSTSTRKKARSRLHHLQPIAYNKPRNASKPTFTPHSRNRSMLSGVPGMKTRTWTLRTLAASNPASGSSRPTSPSYSGRTPNSNTGSPRRRRPIRPPTCRSNPSPSRSTPIRPSSPR